MHDTNKLRRAFGSFMTGVTVVTTTDKNNTPIGFTANSFTSVSMDPPLLLVCPGKHITFYNEFNTTMHFAVSILSEGQEAVSNNFASGPDNRFEKTHWHRDSFGSPIIDNACASFSCRVHKRIEAGDHMVLIGEILEFDHTHSAGLGYSSNGYFSLSKEQQADRLTRRNITGITGAIIKCDDQVLVVNTESGLTIPSVEQHGRHGARSALQQHIEKLGINVTLGPVYSIYNDDTRNQRYTFFLANASDESTAGIGQFIPISELNTSAFPDPAQSTMMSRFATEVRNKVFGLYIGDVETGDVHHTDHTTNNNPG